MKGVLSSEELENRKLDQFSRTQLIATQYRRAMERLKNEGWLPEVVISHSGWGAGLHTREIWPSTHIVSYVEWWFNPESEFFNYDQANKFLNINENKTMTMWRRNQSTALELASSDDIVSPTYWQRSQLPKIFRDKCRVIPDGVDLNLFNPREKRTGSKRVITYAHGMEPMRCFENFIKSTYI